MKDFELTLDNEESMKVHAYEGSKVITVFVWKKEEHNLGISIEINGDEKFVVEVKHAGEEVNITKNLANID